MAQQILYHLIKETRLDYVTASPSLEVGPHTPSEHIMMKGPVGSECWKTFLWQALGFKPTFWDRLLFVFLCQTDRCPNASASSACGSFQQGE